jgi:hypothetical protein
MPRDRVLALILAGGKGSRLDPLTRERSKPAVPFGGRYRIIDFVINNFINSGFFKIKILTQFKSNSLIEHITRTWRLVPEIGQYVDVDGRERLISRAALPSPVYARENAAATVQFAREVSHYDHLREATSGLEGAPLSEKLMAAGVVVISVADIASWFIGGAEEKTAVKTTEAIGFKSFGAFKRMFGVAGEGMQWHHIVEQTASNAAMMSTAPHANFSTASLSAPVKERTKWLSQPCIAREPRT